MLSMFPRQKKLTVRPFFGDEDDPSRQRAPSCWRERCVKRGLELVVLVVREIHACRHKQRHDERHESERPT